MTHRSRLCTVLVDVPAADHAAATAFWAGALGHEAEDVENNPEYTALGEVTPGISFMTQSTGESSPRTHLDIETDDVDAEVGRLTRLGASEVRRPAGKSWVVMRDPVGTTFCVVRVQLPDAFERWARTWD